MMHTFRAVLLLFEENVSEVKDTGDDRVDLQLLSFTDAKRRHGAVSQFEISDVIKLNIAKTSALQELDKTQDIIA